MATGDEALLQVVRSVLAPLVRADGGELYLVAAGPNAVSLHLAGRFAGCPGNALAQRHVLEPALRAAAPEATIVVTSGAIIPPGAQKL